MAFPDAITSGERVTERRRPSVAAAQCSVQSANGTPRSKQRWLDDRLRSRGGRRDRAHSRTATGGLTYAVTRHAARVPTIRRYTIASSSPTSSTSTSEPGRRHHTTQGQVAHKLDSQELIERLDELAAPPTLAHIVQHPERLRRREPDLGLGL